ncbi:hypothetical protein [Deinococcus maricopensis]|uniref:hypothetical protein n=1 Tax=Deinococcus maricopensis TaxID=309887 RepID=UPI0005C176E4|nr:hypothetical protein [Deinococcus maricopensis]
MLSGLLRAFSAEALPGDPPMTAGAAEAHLRAGITVGSFFVWVVNGEVEAHTALTGPTRAVGGGAA